MQKLFIVSDVFIYSQKIFKHIEGIALLYLNL